MSFIRPEARALLQRWAEPLFGFGLAGLGLSFLLQGGWIPSALGLCLLTLGAAWALLAVRRNRFLGDPAAPGLVEIEEGRLRYLHPRMGGEVSLNDLAELRLVTFRGRRVWRLQDLGGRVLLVPLEASGAAALFDALSALPEMTSSGLVAALDATDASKHDAGSSQVPALSAPEDRLVWCRAGSGLKAV